MQRRNNHYRRLVAVLTTASLAVIVTLSFTGVFGAGRGEAPIMQAEPFIGQIGVFGFSFAPRGWAKCDGQLLAISSYQALFSLLGTTYGGDGRTTFGLPDLRGRAALHQGAGPGLTTRTIGQKAGAETAPLDANTMPTHTHVATMKATTTPDPTDNGSATGKVFAPKNKYSSGTRNTDMGVTSITNANTGGGQAHANMQPFLCINFCIALTGIFPSRP